MAEPNVAFGMKVEAACAERGWEKNPQVERAIPMISRETIRKMRAGYVPRAIYVQLFAEGIGEDVNEWMVAAGLRSPDGETEAAPPPRRPPSPRSTWNG